MGGDIRERASFSKEPLLKPHAQLQLGQLVPSWLSFPQECLGKECWALSRPGMNDSCSLSVPMLSPAATHWTLNSFVPTSRSEMPSLQP